jgi:hypothetical protein
MPRDVRERFERFALSLDFTSSTEPERVRRRFLDALFGRIGAEHLVIEEARSFAAVDQAANPEDRNRRPFKIESGWSRDTDTFWWLRHEGIDVDAPENASLLAEAEAVKVALSLDAPANPPTDIAAALASAEHLHRSLLGSSACPDVVQHVSGTLGRAVAKLAGLPKESLDASEGAIPSLVRLADYLVTLPFPEVAPDTEANFENNAAWAPAARIEAAEAIMQLMYRDVSCVQHFRDTVENVLLRDPHPAVRNHIADRLTSLWEVDQAWMWQLAERIAGTETNRGGLKFFANYFLGRVVHHAPEKVETLTFVLAERDFVRDEKATDGLLEEIGSLVTLLWISHGRERARQSIQRWLEDAPTFEAELGHAIAISRGALVLKYSSNESRDLLITDRAQEFAAWLVNATAQGLESSIARASEADLTEDDKRRMRLFARLLNDMSDQFFFASGAFERQADDEPGLPSIDAKIAFLADNHATFRRIADAGTPATIFHLIELLEFLISADPPRIFDLVAHALLGAGKRHGYQFESLGADRFVGLIGRFLADYRAIFADEERQARLVACLDAFMEAGWPAARRLLYRLPELLQ